MPTNTAFADLLAHWHISFAERCLPYFEIELQFQINICQFHPGKTLFAELFEERIGIELFHVEYARLTPLSGHGVSATAYASQGHFKKIGNDAGFSPGVIASHFRQKLLAIYKRYHIGGDEFAVVAALMLGYNDALTRELMDSYSVTGAMRKYKCNMV